MQDRLPVRTAAQRPTGGSLMMRYRAPGLIAALEVLGDLGCDRIQPAAPGKLEPGANPCMTERSSPCRQPFVEKLAIEVVAKGVELSDVSVRPNLLTGRDNENALA